MITVVSNHSLKYKNYKLVKFLSFSFMVGTDGTVKSVLKLFSKTVVTFA